ncbi:terminase [Lentisphaerota bacterium WC36G]|nr:terminase [Lentisphaerae bacterium WC36]
MKHSILVDFEVGNLLNKKSKEKQDLSILNECLSNQFWRLNNLYSISDKKGQKIKFNFNNVQNQFFHEMHNKNIILKARQFGFTTFCSIFLLDYCLFNRGIRAGQLAHNVDDAKVFFRDKVLYAYQNLNSHLKQALPLKKNESGEILIAHDNNFKQLSGIRVGTSLRSGTLQLLHISELGKIAAKYPEKALEIKTGTLNSISSDGIVIIESTAEGREGLFFDMCQKAMYNAKKSQPLTALDYKFHFFPWWKNPDYSLNVSAKEQQQIIVPERLSEYFAKLALDENIILTENQKLWYALKETEQGDEIKREYPSTAEEAFEQSIDGAYYSTQLDYLYKNNAINKVGYDPNLGVETYWDLGIRDEMTIWFAQKTNSEIRIIDYYECTDKGLNSVIEDLKAKKYHYSRHVAPHDIMVRELSSGRSRWEISADLGLNFDIAPRMSLMDGINAVRQILPFCKFDAAKCELGIKGLQMYRKSWDAKNGIWGDKPVHDLASHRADSFRMLAIAIDFDINYEKRQSLLTKNQQQYHQNDLENNHNSWT